MGGIEGLYDRREREGHTESKQETGSIARGRVGGKEWQTWQRGTFGKGSDRFERDLMRIERWKWGWLREYRTIWEIESVSVEDDIM